MITERPPGDRSEYQTLNGLRGVAAGAVMIYHYRDILGPTQTLPGAYLAVDLFFLMSGFVIAHAYEAKLLSGRLSLWGFVWRRVVRLYPLYLAGLVLGLAYFVAKALADPGEATPITPAVVALGTLGLPTFALDRPLYPFNPASWSLFFEFVANLGYAACITRLSNRILAVIAVVSGVALYVAARHLGSLDHGSVAGNAWVGLVRVTFSFTLGVLMWRKRFRLQVKSQWLMFCPMLGAIAVVVVPAAAGQRAAYDLICVVILFPALVLAAVAVQPYGAALGFCRVSGDLSYPVYLLHGPTFMVAAAGYKLAVSPDLSASQPYLGMVSIAATVVGSLTLFRLYDVPVRKFLTSARLDWQTRPAS